MTTRTPEELRALDVRIAREVMGEDATWDKDGAYWFGPFADNGEQEWRMKGGPFRPSTFDFDALAALDKLNETDAFIVRIEGDQFGCDREWNVTIRISSGNKFVAASQENSRPLAICECILAYLDFRAKQEGKV